MKLRLEPEDLDALAEAVAAKLRRATPTTETLRLDELGVPVLTARAAIKAGELPALKVGREYRVRPSDRDAWLESLKVRPRAKGDPTPRPQTAAQRAIDRARRSGTLRAIPGGS